MTTDLTQINSHDLMTNLEKYVQIATAIGLEKLKLNQEVGDAEINLKALKAKLFLSYKTDRVEVTVAKFKMECDEIYVAEAKKFMELKTRLIELESQHEVMTKAIGAINGISFVVNSEMKLQRG